MMPIVARAPARISFSGGGTDLAAYYIPHGGCVLSAAINRYAYVRVEEPQDGALLLSSIDYQVDETIPRGQEPSLEGPLSLPRAALRAFWDRGVRERGAHLWTSSEVIPGTGLGSSSAMAVALVRALACYCGVPMPASEVAEMACRLEIDMLGMPIGKQDQYASASGGINTIEFTGDGVCVRSVDLPLDVTRMLEDRLLLFSTGTTREARSILQQQRKDTCTDSEVLERLHRLKALAIEMRGALMTGDLDGFGHLLDAAWGIKRGVARGVTSTAIDRWYALARAAGALGGKITGAGGGGHLLLYSPLETQAAVRAAMVSAGLREVPFGFDGPGAIVVGEPRDAEENVVSDSALLSPVGWRVER